MTRLEVMEHLIETHEGGTFMGQEFKVVGEPTDIDPEDTETGFTGCTIQLGDRTFHLHIYNG